MLDASILSFVNIRGFGYMKDRRHVAGFLSHRFAAIPEPVSEWHVETLELVSLLLHDEPVIYVSDRLPEMTRHHDTATRPLDRFERFALPTLEEGEDLVTAQTEEGLRMLGAVRSNRQCIACHGGNRGDLLGAFSYALRSERGEE